MASPLHSRTSRTSKLENFILTPVSDSGGYNNPISTRISDAQLEELDRRCIEIYGDSKHRSTLIREVLEKHFFTPRKTIYDKQNLQSKEMKP